MARVCACVICFLLLAAMPTTAQAPGLSEMYALFRAEETNNSKIMWIIHEIADVYGPRVTGTPNLKAADDWVDKTMAAKKAKAEKQPGAQGITMDQPK